MIVIQKVQTALILTVTAKLAALKQEPAHLMRIQVVILQQVIFMQIRIQIKHAISFAAAAFAALVHFLSVIEF